jgi:crotonobetainyl-CoA:carnitine CoA-transferase CaiB-like acyl-CoA transferase
MSDPNHGPLARFKVIDLTRVRAGPTAVRQLADWGADVIKIESPEGDAGLGGERHGPDFQNLHRNKRSLTLNLKSPDGVAVMKRLVAQADVVVENYRPDVKFRLGVDYESLRSINPRIVYASISGFGQDGPYRDRPGFDQIAQGMGGLMSITGEPGRGPMRVGIPVADLTAGVFAAMGILIALLEREQSGEGQWVKSSLLGAQISMLDFQAARWTIGKDVPGDKLYATGRARSQNRDALNEAIGAITRGKSSAEWIEALNKAGVPSGPIYKMNEVFADPQVKHLGMTRTVPHKVLGDVEVVGQPIELSRTPWSIRTATPEAGEHTDAVLAELGYSVEEIAGLHAGKVV